jgi:hypothetical protein
MNHVRALNARDKSFKNFLSSDILRYFQFLLSPTVNTARLRLPISHKYFVAHPSQFFHYHSITKRYTYEVPIPFARGLRLGSAAVHLPGLRARIPEVCLLWLLCVVWYRSLHRADLRPEEFCRVLCVSECDHEALIMRRPWPTRGMKVHGK